MENFTVIMIEWNCYNGFMFDILEINSRSLFGLSIGWKSYILLNLLWFRFEWNLRKECINKVNGSCRLHNLHCAYPECEE